MILRYRAQKMPFGPWAVFDRLLLLSKGPCPSEKAARKTAREMNFAHIKSMVRRWFQRESQC